MAFLDTCLQVSLLIYNPIIEPLSKLTVEAFVHKISIIIIMVLDYPKKMMNILININYET